MSPELLDPERFGLPDSPEANRPTRRSDCYALGMVIYEVGAVFARVDLLTWVVNWWLVP